mmetsp:Transcript_29496/g.41126  ORF Transcript_29496/g.41126 Transcript_29496/m.41126 type:complete len:93 (-) Transcript_29496:537-815(-)
MEELKTDNRSSSSVKTGVEFISTNDIVTSWFLKLVNAPLGLMAMNMRGRTGGALDLDSKQVGNYEAGIYYAKSDYQSPVGNLVQNIRNTSDS